MYISMKKKKKKIQSRALQDPPEKVDSIWKNTFSNNVYSFEEMFVDRLERNVLCPRI